MIKHYFENNKKYFEVHVAVRNKFKKIISRKKSGITSEREAKQVEFQLKTELNRIVSIDSIWTWSKWSEEVLRRVRIKFKKATVINYEAYLKNWIPASWCNILISEINTDDIYNVINASSVKLSPVSQGSFLKIIRRIFQEACEEGLINKNPAKNVFIKITEPVKKVLTTNEVDTLLKKAKDLNHRFYPIWCFAVKTGMRSGEMYALLWSDIDFERNLVSVSKQWTKKDGVTSTKSGDNRVVPISNDLKQFLIELKKGSNREHVLPRISEWTNAEQAKVLREFCSGIGITEVKFHDLRATFITNMLSQGVSLVKVMSIVGHKKMETTDIYLRLSGVDLKNTTEVLSYKLPNEIEADNVIKVNFGKS